MRSGLARSGIIGRRVVAAMAAVSAVVAGMRMGMGLGMGMEMVVVVVCSQWGAWHACGPGFIMYVSSVGYNNMYGWSMGLAE